MRILIIEDDLDLCQVLRRHLESEGFLIDIANNGERGSYIARTNAYNLIILDNSLPVKNGLIVCREIRSAGNNVPILLISVHCDETAKVTFLESGADDYLTKPFSFTELIARIRALLRRPYVIQESKLIIDDLSVDILKQNVTRGNKKIYLTRKEFLLLECLMRQTGKVVSRGQIMDQVWETDCDPFSNTLEAHIRNLRKKVDIRHRKLIHTISGRGYKIDRVK